MGVKTERQKHTRRRQHTDGSRTPTQNTRTTLTLFGKQGKSLQAFCGLNISSSHATAVIVVSHINSSKLRLSLPGPKSKVVHERRFAMPLGSNIKLKKHQNAESVCMHVCSSNFGFEFTRPKIKKVAHDGVLTYVTEKFGPNEMAKCLPGPPWILGRVDSNAICFTCMHSNACMHAFACICVCMHACVYVRMYVCICVCNNMHDMHN
jgi:hypothetical protein